MIASADGGTAVSGVSGGLGNRDDHAVFAALRAHADGVVVGLGTVIAEGYQMPEWTHPLATRVVGRPGWSCYVAYDGGEAAGADPWGGGTLEWVTDSPPPACNFAAIPVVQGREPLWEPQGVAGHVARTLALAGVPNADAAASAIVALETKMARAHASRAESLDVLKANNPWRREDFARKAPGLDWDAFLAGARLGTEPVIIAWHPGAVRGLSALVRSEPLDSWKRWLTFHAIDRNAAVLPKAFVDERFAFHGKVLNGTPQLAERWKRGVAATNAAIPEAVGQIYVARYFPPETKAQMQAMVKNLVTAFGARIDRLEWLSPDTKRKARQKLATLRVGVGYPDTWVDYRGLQIVKGDAFGNRQRAELFEYERHLKKLGKPVDKGEWWMSPQTVNALNLPLQNALNFPAAILAPPFFDPAATAAANYGATGATIGHEITHSFDDQGAMFDADGRLSNWWTKEDLEHFRAAGKQLAAQFDAYAPFPDLHVNGTQTLSENIADVAGLAAAYDGWRLSLGGGTAPVVGGFTGPQQFFLAYSQSWLVKWREPALRQAVITDGHAPGEYRADAVRNLDEWYEAFDVKPGRRLYLAPGMKHCSGGAAAVDSFDLLSAVVDWVEKGAAPNSVTGTSRAQPGRSRPLCSYPEYARYKGQGDPEAAASFECSK